MYIQPTNGRPDEVNRSLLMRILCPIFLLIICLVMPFDVGAERSGPPRLSKPLGVLINNLDLTTSRTIDIGNQGKGYGVLGLYFKHTNSGASNISMTCTASDDAHATPFDIQTCDTTTIPGTCTSIDAKWSKDVAGNKNWPWRVEIESFEDIRCTVTNTGGGASDFIKVTGRLAVKG